MKQKRFTLVIIGAGSAGLSAAALAADLGLGGVAIVEQEERLGGECLHFGCVPSKAMIHAAHEYPDDPVAAWKHIRSSIETIEKRSDNAEHVEKTGVTVLQGAATFLNRHALQVGDDIIRSKYFLIATGSTPSVPPIEGLDTVPYLTNETFFTQKSLPKRLVIIGGGPIGCELAGAAAGLGSQVTLLQSGERLLPRETAKVGRVVLQGLESRGVQVMLNADTKKVSEKNGTFHLTVAAGGAHELRADAVLVAAGRVPRTEGIGLEAAGVKVSERGLETDQYQRTSRRHIYAAGDVTTSPKFTHLAAQQAGLAVRNMLSGPFKKSVTSLSDIPAITFTDPEVARFGMDSDMARKVKELTVLELEYSEIDRAITDEYTGFIEVVFDRDGTLQGATIVGPQASELLSPLLVAAHHGVTLDRLATTMFAYPTLASGLNLLASRYAAQQAARRPTLKFIRLFWKRR
jgi:pyruvate/2-oxoglutarate dehydrogenase complex dihydrolipoamide dehydrogenase (E3) component